VSVPAAWRASESPPKLADISVTVAVPEIAEAMSNGLAAALAERIDARSLDGPLRFRVSTE
jgi:hypothetical protein